MRPQVAEMLGFSVLDRFGKRLREERIRQGLDQTDFGRLVDVSKNSQSAYESGRTSPPVEYLLKLSQHGVDIGYVLTGRHNDGALGVAETQIIEMFDKLSERDREVVFSLLCVLTGNMASVDQPKQLAPTLHQPDRSYKGKDDD